MTADGQNFLKCVLQNPINAAIIERIGALELRDCWLVSGSLFQTVWNVQTGRDPTYGIKDYDLFYFDSGDVSWEAEDAVIRRCAGVFGNLDADIQVRNQARVHLWYEEKFGAAYSPLSSSCDGIDRFTTPSSMYGVTTDERGKLRVYAPYGYSDPFELVVRPNPTSVAVAYVYEEKTARWKNAWPELHVTPFD